MKILVVVDMQNDFIDGALGTPEAQAIVPNVVKKINNWNDMIFVTQDTHSAEKYPSTLEGKKLPVKHCVYGSEGWQMNSKIDNAVFPHWTDLSSDSNVEWFTKHTFGSMELVEAVRRLDYNNEVTEIEIVGLCTNICVVSNAILLRAAFPNMPITVDASCCAGVTPETHKAALTTMRSCQIDVIGEE